MTTAELLFGLGYAASAAIAFAAAASRRREGSREAWAWLLVALVLVLFAVLRVTAVHEIVVTQLRVTARSQDWYDQREAIQGALLEILVATGLLVLLLFAIAVRYLRAAILTAVTGVVLLGLLSLARAMSFHRLDDITQREIGPLNLAQYEELILLLFVAGAALVTATKKGAADDDRAPGISQAEEA